MNDRLVVTGFDSHDELDRFVRAEIRTFRSRDMRVVRSEAAPAAGGSPGPALVLAFGDRPDLAPAAAALSRRYPRLALTLSRAGEPAGLPEIEEIYSTF